MDGASNDMDDQLHSMVCRVVSYRKKYPALLVKIEEEIIKNELKRWDNVKVDLESEDYIKELTALVDDVARVASYVKANPVTTTEANDVLLKNQLNMEEISKFINFLATLPE